MTVAVDVKLTQAERKAIGKIIGGQVFQDARLQVKVRIQVRKV
jgi:hypothetical protein